MSTLKQERPHNWPPFINEIISSCHTNLSICENNMAILRLELSRGPDFIANPIGNGPGTSHQSHTLHTKALLCVSKHILEFFAFLIYSSAAVFLSINYLLQALVDYNHQAFLRTTEEVRVDGFPAHSTPLRQGLLLNDWRSERALFTASGGFTSNARHGGSYCPSVETESLSRGE